MLPPIVAQGENVVVDREMYRARADGDYTPVESGCGKRGAAGPAQRQRRE
jgi:hypothetical protein